MSKIKRQQPGYSGGIPLAVGDRYYAQDLTRDFWAGLDFQSTMMRGIVGTAPALLRGGLVAKGTNFDDLNITPAFGIVGYQVTTPDDFSSLPPSTQTEDILALIVESTQQINLDISSTATLDGVTTNYVKLRYKDDDGPTRNRAKKSGSYVYEVEPSFEFIVDDVANTIYDCLLATFVGDGSSVLTITQELAYFEQLSWPVGSTYIQFPGDDDPSTLGLPGTWSNVSSELAGDFIRFEGGDASSFEAGQQLDQFQGHAHSSVGSRQGATGGTTSLSSQAGSNNGLDTINNAGNPGVLPGITGPITFQDGTPRDGAETRPVNRTVRKWRRTA